MIPASLPYQYLQHFDRHDRTPRSRNPINALTARSRSGRAMERPLGRPAKLRGKLA